MSATTIKRNVWLWAIVLLPLVTVAGVEWFLSAPVRKYDEAMLLDGARVFRTRCEPCHAISDIAPSLKGLAATAATRKPGISAAEYTIEAILRPSEFLVPGYSATMPSGLQARHRCCAQ